MLGVFRPAVQLLQACLAGPSACHPLSNCYGDFNVLARPCQQRHCQVSMNLEKLVLHLTGYLPEVDAGTLLLKDFL